MATIFLTGASGFIGGDVLYLLAKTHPEYKISALVRDEAKARQISAIFKDVRAVQGDLDDAEIIDREAREADLILNLAATGHLKSVQTFHRALAETNRQKPTHWIQVSGASALAAAEIADGNRVPGSESSVIFDDLDGLSEITSVIRAHPSRTVDNYLLDIAANSPQVNTALVFPPIIYGVGRGPVNQRSIQIPELARVTLQRKRGLQVGKGLSRWGNVHIQDVSDLFVRLVEKAVNRTSDNELWNENGLYLASVGEMTFGDISKQVAAAAAKQGLIPNDDVEELGAADANSLLPHGAVLYGTNARCSSRRGRELLGWAPHQESLAVEIPRHVEFEAKRLGIS